MFAFVFAVISLSSIAPDPVVTPAAALRERISGATGFARADALPVPDTSDITVAPACTFGVPQFGGSLWNDAASLARFTQPQCAGLGSSAPWLPAFGSGPIRLEPALLQSATSGPRTSFSAAPLPARFTLLAPSSRGASGSVLRAPVRAGGEPIFARLPAAAPRITERRH